MDLGRHAAGCADINRTRVSGEAVDAAPGLRPGSRKAPDRVPNSGHSRRVERGLALLSHG
jgi:hypothetical protein